MFYALVIILGFNTHAIISIHTSKYEAIKVHQQSAEALQNIECKWRDRQWYRIEFCRGCLYFLVYF